MIWPSSVAPKQTHLTTGERAGGRQEPRGGDGPFAAAYAESPSPPLPPCDPGGAAAIQASGRGRGLPGRACAGPARGRHADRDVWPWPSRVWGRETPAPPRERSLLWIRTYCRVIANLECAGHGVLRGTLMTMRTRGGCPRARGCERDGAHAGRGMVVAPRCDRASVCAAANRSARVISVFVCSAGPEHVYICTYAANLSAPTTTHKPVSTAHRLPRRQTLTTKKTASKNTSSPYSHASRLAQPPELDASFHTAVAVRHPRTNQDVKNRKQSKEEKTCSTGRYRA